jgi:hypothetical protein
MFPELVYYSEVSNLTFIRIKLPKIISFGCEMLFSALVKLWENQFWDTSANALVALAVNSSAFSIIYFRIILVAETGKCCAVTTPEDITVLQICRFFFFA